MATLFFFFPFLLPGACTGQELHKVPAVAPMSDVQWKSTKAVHAYGLPEIKPNKNGTLTLDGESLTFTGKSSNTYVPRKSIVSAASGNDRVELWGAGGRLMRMAIPNGGKLAAAAVMHHRVDMLTVDFLDVHGGMHSAVFYLPANEAALALKSFQNESYTSAKPQQNGCGTNPVEPRSALVMLPDWDRVEVPAAYRGLVYEHVIDRLKAIKDAGSVYRFGEVSSGSACPQYTIQIAVEGYKKGNQVIRAATGPIGMFTSATQMTFTVTYEDQLTGVRKEEEVKAAVRTESESTSVADAVAKKLAKQYGNLLKAPSAPDKKTAQPS